MERVIPHLRSNLVAYLALFVALGGTTYAAMKIEKNAVRSKQIKDGQVKAKDLGDDAVSAAKVANGSLLGEDFAPGQLPAGAQGQPGLDATNLFAFISDTGAAGTAQVGYGSGVIGVTDTVGNGNYFVAFNRNLENCVVHATTGFGEPAGSGSLLLPGYPTVSIAAGTNQEARVGFANDAGDPTDSSFLISAFC